MHELSLCESIIEIIQENAVQQGYRKVISVWLEVGELSCVEQQALSFCFDSVTQDTLADGARLNIVPISGLGHCQRCRQNSSVTTRIEACPHCGHYPLSLIQGEELRVKELEVE